MRVGRGCHFLHPGSKQRAKGRQWRESPGRWGLRDFCLPTHAHPLQYKEEMSPILFRMLLWFCLEYICALDKRLGPYILEKITGEGQPSLQLVAGILLRRWTMDWLVGRTLPSFWHCKSWAWIQQPRHTRCPCHVETVRNFDIVKPQGSHIGELSFTFTSVLDSWSSPHSLRSLVRTQPDLNCAVEK